MLDVQRLNSPVDILLKMWYYILVRRDRGTKSRTKKILKKSKKVLDKSSPI